MQVLDVCNHLLSKMAPWREDRYDIAEEATINFMTKLRDGVKDGPGRRGKNAELRDWNPVSVTTMARFEILPLLYSQQQQWEDSCISLEEYNERRLREEER